MPLAGRASGEKFHLQGCKHGLALSLIIALSVCAVDPGSVVKTQAEPDLAGYVDLG